MIGKMIVVLIVLGVITGFIYSNLSIEKQEEIKQIAGDDTKDLIEKTKEIIETISEPEDNPLRIGKPVKTVEREIEYSCKSDLDCNSLEECHNLCICEEDGYCYLGG